MFLDTRLRDVFQAAAKLFGWPGKKVKQEHGVGLGGGIEKGGYVATCAEVVADDVRSVRVVRVVLVVTAFECGAIVNPDGLRNQIVGANIMELGGALFEAIEFTNGRILNARFSRYRVPVFATSRRYKSCYSIARISRLWGAVRDATSGSCRAPGKRDLRRHGRATY
jgi:isoquinoline 1-oxidoreductase